MKLPITSLGSKSPNFDLNPVSLGADDVTYAINYLLRDNKYISFNSESTLSPIGSGSNPGYIDFIATSIDNLYLVACRNAVKAYDVSTGTWTDISNLNTYGMGADDELSWTGCKLGQIPIITNGIGYPEYWAPLSLAQKMQDLKFDATNTWRQKNYKCKAIRSHLNFLFALNLTEGGVEFPNSYRWSHPADINGLPFSWDELDLSTIASKEMIGEEFIIDGLSLRDDFCIYTNRGVHLLRYTGSSELPFERRPISKTNNSLAIDNVVEVLGVHYILMNGDIMVNDGNSIYSILHKKQKRYLESIISSANYKNCFIKYNPVSKEIWFFIVKQGAKYPNIAIIVNHIDNTVSIRDLAGQKSTATFGIVTTIQANDLWNSESVLTWNSDSSPWNVDSSAPLSSKIVAINNDTGILKNLEPSGLSGLGTLNTVIERTNLEVDDSGTVTTITRVYPDIKSNGAVTIEVGSHNYVGAPVRWKPAVTYTPNLGRKVDIRSTGVLHAWRVKSTSDVYFELNGLTIEYESAGSRIGGFIPTIVR